VRWFLPAPRISVARGMLLCQDAQGPDGLATWSRSCPAITAPLAAVLAANVVSITGNALTQIAVPWFVLQSTGSAARAGIVAFCTLQLAGVLQFWMLCTLMAVTGLFHAPGETARGVLLPTLAERAGMPLTRAAGLYDGASRFAGMIGAALGGVLIALLGAENVLLLDAATFTVSAFVLAFGLRGLPEAQAQPRVEPASLRTYRHELGEGYRYVVGTPLVLGICLMTLTTRGLDQGWSAVLLPVHTRDELGGSVDLGLLEAMFSVGALTGALIYGAVGSRFRRWPVFTVAFLIVGMPRFAVAAFTDTFAPLAVMMAVEGLACGVLNPILATVMYETVPEELRSRVLSATTASVLTITPLGGLAAGFLVDSAGLTTAMLTVGGVYLLATLSPIFPVWRQMDALASRRASQRT
jgi:predicted MFS family arabinose efflux permease